MSDIWAGILIGMNIGLIIGTASFACGVIIGLFKAGKL